MINELGWRPKLLRRYIRVPPEHVLDTLRLLMDMVEVKTLGWVSQQFGRDWWREFIWRSSDEMSMVLNANSGAVLPQPLAQQLRDWLEMSATSSFGRMGT